eukprot:TRINITY_DN67717_c3_g1_i1.p1 TRINITY_DN67717_c3_g1~~TRINITY_DN67717_c3_g1_i1.p1  ORF type:complete len:309 (+),score=49.37 TRINITY_DN67717_c3_g1_i1:34-927(+)
MRKHPEIWTDDAFDTFKKAYSLILSRGFHDSGKGPFLVPGIDMFNHSNEPHTSMVFDGSVPCFFVTADKPIQKGDQITLHYGDLSNALLLHGYGFILERNKHNCVKLEWPLIDEAASELDQLEQREKSSAQFMKRKLDLLRSLPWAQGPFVITSEDMMPDEFLSVAQVICMKEEEFDEYNSGDKGILGPEYTGEEAGGHDFHLCVYHLIVDIVKRQLKRYTGATTDLRQQLLDVKDLKAKAERSKSTTDYLDYCVGSVRTSEKSMLHSLAQQCLAEIDELQALMDEEDEEEETDSED